MNKKYEYEFLHCFLKDVKKLSKKYKSLKIDLKNFIDNFDKILKNSTEIKPNIFKSRLSIKSKGRGKSGGARIITYKVTKDLKVYFLHIYDKSQKSSVHINYIDELISKINDE